jgi:diguanylate cyclase (GGDEF)-like protein/PAS domain S-box-containing protein
MNTMSDESWTAKVGLDQFVGQLNDSIMITDHEGRIVMVNRAFESLTGYSAEETKGQHCSLIDSDVHPREVFEEMIEKLSAGEPFRFIFTRRKKNGELHQEGSVVSPIRDAQGELIFSVTIGRAIFQSRTTYDNFTLLAEASPVPVYLLQDDTFCFVNEPFMRLTGYSREDMLGQNWQELVAPEDWAPVRAQRDNLKADESSTHEHRIRVKDGSLHWVLETLRPVRISGFGASVPGSHEGQRHFIGGSFVDITIQKQNQSDLARALALYSATAESTTDGIIIIDRDRRVLGCNQRFREMWALDGIEPGSNADVLYDHALRLLKDPEGYRQRWAETHSNYSLEASDVVELVDGRILGVYSKPLLIDGEPYGRVWSWRDVTTQHKLEAQLKHQAFHDSLTGLANRAHFIETLELALAERSDSGPLFLLFLDIDDFKSVNDRFGHGTGDRVLTTVGHRITDCLRASDLVARLGGDEFAVLLYGADTMAGAARVAERILTAIRAPIFVEDHEVMLEASIGIGECREDTANTLLGNADVAMYAAKAKGKGRIQIYEEGMRALAVERQTLVAELRQALEHDELVVYYQPGFELATGRMMAAEALLRWKHPQRGLLLPDSFIRLAEESGLIGAIGEFVLAQALEVVARWQDLYSGSRLGMGINVSPRQLNDPDFAMRVGKAIEAAGVHPARVLLEITESALIDDPENATRALNELKALGVMLALDDFGTGYSSLSYLKDLPIDVLKIDRTFVDNINTSRKELLLTRTTIALGHELGLRIVAEGIERQDQLDKLIELQCELGQGFLFSPPITLDELNAFMEGHELARGLRAA